MTKVVMPRLSEAMETGKVIRWLKKEGDRVQGGDILVEVETDKADVEMEAFGAGVLRKILVPAGERARVGALIGVIAEPDEGIWRVLSAALIDRLSYRVFYALLILTAVGWFGVIPVAIVHATIVEVPKEVYMALTVLGGAGFSLMLVLGALGSGVGWFASRLKKGFVAGFALPFAKGLAISVVVLIVVAIGLFLGEEYGLLVVHPTLFKWIGGLLAVSIVGIFLMLMMFD